MRARWGSTVLLLGLLTPGATGCASLLGIEDTVVGDAAVDDGGARDDAGDGGVGDGGDAAVLPCGRLDDPDRVSLAISAARAAVGAVNLRIEDAQVTYVALPVLLGTGVRVVWLAGQAGGPGLTLAVPTAQLPADLRAGDRISFDVLNMNPAGAARVANLVGNVVTRARDCPAFAPTPTTPEKLSAEAANLDGRVVAIGLPTSGMFTYPTRGLTSIAAYTGPAGSTTLNVTDLAAEQADLVPGCAITLAAVPVLASGMTANVFAYRASDLQLSGCPGAPVLAVAWARSPNTVELFFDRPIAPSSVRLDGAQFTYTNAGMATTMASASGRRILLTTTTQVPGMAYGLRIGAGLQGVGGQPYVVPLNPVMFNGYTPAPMVVVNEVHPLEPVGCDQVELRAVTGGDIGTLNFQTASGIVFAFPSAVVARNDLIIVHLYSAGLEVSCNPTSLPGETTSKIQFPALANPRNYDNAWDFYALAPMAGSLRSTDDVLLTLVDSGAWLDAMFIGRTAGTMTLPATDSFANSARLVGQWHRAGGGMPPGGFVGAEFHLEAVPVENVGALDGNTVQRSGNVDGDARTDWGLGTATWAQRNAGQSDL